MRTFQTGFVDDVPLEFYYEIDKNCYEVDEMLKVYFNKCRLCSLGSNGGTEFYDADTLTIEILESFFDKCNIVWEKITPNNIFFEDVRNELTEKDIKKIKKENIVRLLTQSRALKNKDARKIKLIDDNFIKLLNPWQIELSCNFDNFIKSNNKTGLIIAPTGCGKSFMINYWMMIL